MLEESEGLNQEQSALYEENLRLKKQLEGQEKGWNQVQQEIQTIRQTS